MTTCKNCATQFSEDSAFCPNCGTPAQPEAAKQEATGGSFTDKMADLNNTPDSTDQFDPQDIEKNKVMALFAYIIFLIPLLAAKDSPFARFHTNQGLILFIGALATSVVAMIPFIGWIVSSIAAVAVTVLSVIGIINAAGGKAKELPLIGKFKLLK